MVKKAKAAKLNAHNPNGKGLKPNAKGAPRRGGRLPGQPNKMTRLLKDAIILAGAEVGDVEMYLRSLLDPTDEAYVESTPEERGQLVGYLKWLAINEPKSYTGLLGRLVPQQVSLTADDDKPAEKFTTQEAVAAELIKRGLPTSPIFGAYKPLAIDYKKETTE